MLQKEFEERVGMKVTPSEYGVIETLYNDSDLEKDEFCTKWKKNDRMEMGELNANTITTLNKRIFSKDAKVKEHEETIKQTAYFLIRKASTNDDIELYEEAISLIGRNDAISYKLANDYSLTIDDRDYLINKLNS